MKGAQLLGGVDDDFEANSVGNWIVFIVLM